MNLYGLIILSALLLGAALTTLADLLNLKALRPDLPTEMEGVYDAEAYRKSQAYTRVTTRFGMLTATFTRAATLLFWFSGGFNALDRIARQGGFGSIPTGLIYIGILALLQGLLSLPFNIYSTFVIEEHFGFNKTTPATFGADRIKGLALSIALGGPLLAALLALFEFAGAPAWLYAWIATTLFILFVQFIAPTWIMPLFNKFKPLEAGELKERIMGYARSVDFSIDNVFVMDGSRKIASMSDVKQFPRRTQITFGGGPKRKLRW